MTGTEKSPRSGLANRLYTGESGYDFVGRRRIGFIVFGALVVASLLILLFRPLSLGIEFEGGTDFQAPVAVEDGTVEAVREATASFTVPDLDAQVFSIGDTAVRVQTRSLTQDEITQTRTDLAELVQTDADEVTYNTIGGSWGAQISQQAAVALVVFVVLVMALIAIYFRDWRMAVAAIVALAHDMIVTVGVYAAVGFTVTPSTLIGVLTILAYSLYDTVVVFDKVKENTKGITETNQTYSERANLAINQVLVRSLNTTVIGVLPVLAMFIAGVLGQSAPLQDLGLALLVGMIAGAFSSLFIAPPLLAVLKERTPAMRAHRESLAEKAAAAELPEAATETVELETTEEGETVRVVTKQRRRTAQSRAQRKGKR